MEAGGLVIVWHSRTGAARAMAQAAFEGACASGPVVLLAAEEAMAEALLGARGYVFACPENLGSMSGAMKDFFDRAYYPLLGRLEGRPYATMIAAGSDGSGAQRQLDRIVTGWRLRRIADPLVANFDAQTPERILAPKRLPDAVAQNCRDLGRAFAEGLALGVF